MIELGGRICLEAGAHLIGLWEHPTDPCKVIKQVTLDDPWFFYALVLWIKKPRNKHLLKVFDIYIEDDSAYVTVERLYHLTDRWRNRIRGLEHHVYIGLPILHPELVCLLPALKIIRRFFVRRGHSKFDLHYYNLMARPDGCVVLLDPIW